MLMVPCLSAVCVPSLLNQSVLPGAPLARKTTSDQSRLALSADAVSVARSGHRMSSAVPNPVKKNRNG